MNGQKNSSEHTDFHIEPHLVSDVVGDCVRHVTNTWVWIQI